MNAEKWREVRAAMLGVRIDSCADGTLRVTPKWRKSYTGGTLIPGVISRIYAARLMKEAVNAELRGK